ncbi:MAG: Bro-N domain-containing protein [Nanoarchaeota archaeon]|nr:Bro-N domain-containing protein [Nanoarchaeota archaeon]
MNKLVVFQGKNVRRTWFNEEWWFVIEDIISVLTDSKDPKQYINKMRNRDEELSKGWVQFVHTLPISTKGGLQDINCANTEGIFRIIQSIPSKKAEPFKQWLAEVGYDRVKEIENPELAQDRVKKYYELKGYPQDWVDKRLRGIAIRQDLTDEWKERGIEKQKDFAILTAEISKATFDMTPSEYKKHKDLPKQSKTNLRDHMNDLELIFTMLGERMTTEISQEEKPDTFNKNKKVAKRGGNVAGNARKNAEKELGRPVTTKQNYLPKKKKKLLEEKKK